MPGKEIRTVAVQIEMDVIPDPPDCLLCETLTRTQKVILDFGIPDQNPVVRNSLLDCRKA